MEYLEQRSPDPQLCGSLHAAAVHIVNRDKIHMPLYETTHLLRDA